MEQTISKEELGQFLINYHNLNRMAEFVGKDGAMDYFQRVRSVQYDPLNVVGRNADLVLQARVQGYNQQMLHDLLYKERALIDGVDKEMCIYKVEDYPFFSRVREENVKSTNSVLIHFEQLDALNLLDDMRALIREKSAVNSNDVSKEVNTESNHSYKKLSSAALDYLYRSGELCISTKKGTRKYYDFASNVLDKQLLNDIKFESEVLFLEWYIKRRLKSVGALWEKRGAGWLGYYLSNTSERKLALARLCDKGELLRFSVTGIDTPFYILKEDEKFFAYKEKVKVVKFLAPLDNMLWDRNMISALFDFDYRWEVYTPVAKRKYGYYVLPVLYGTNFIARLEAEKTKPGEPFRIKHWWWEPNATISWQMLDAINLAIIEFGNYLGVPVLKDYSDVFNGSK